MGCSSIGKPFSSFARRRDSKSPIAASGPEMDPRLREGDDLLKEETIL